MSENTIAKDAARVERHGLFAVYTVHEGEERRLVFRGNSLPIAVGAAGTLYAAGASEGVSATEVYGPGGVRRLRLPARGRS